MSTLGPNEIIVEEFEIAGESAVDEMSTRSAADSIQHEQKKDRTS